MEIELLSPAKVNLFLKVTGERPDGYHEILSLIQPISLFDVVRIVVEDGETITVDVTGDYPVAGGPENLAYQAAFALLDKLKEKKAVTIKIDKKIPVGAGLGGGSSNAASVLMGLNDLLGTPLNSDDLAAISADIGSDVPFFLLKGSALASGRGEILEKISIPLYDYVLINPGFEVSSSWAYANLDLTKKEEDNNLLYSKAELMDNRHIGRLLFNDLEIAVLARYPELTELKNLLGDTAPDGILMSGSGPTLFALYADAGKAKEALALVKGKLNEGSRAFLARGA